MSVAGFRVRVAGAADLAVVVEMERSIAEAPHWVETEYKAIVNANGDDDGAVRRCLMIAEATEGRLLGFAVGNMVGVGWEGLGEVESVAVVSAARRGGVGRALCKAVIDWCRWFGAAAVELEVRAGNVGAIALYSELGFVSVGRRREYYRGPVEDALVMKLEFRERDNKGL